MDILEIKSLLLANSKIQVSNYFKNNNELNYKGNLFRNNWIFLKLNESSRVRMILSNDSNLMLCNDNYNGTYIYDIKSKQIIIKNINIEYPIAHAPEQMFFTLYRQCIRGCKFCPLTYNNESIHHSLNDIFGRIKNSELPKSIGITTSNPPYLSTSDITDEICFLTKKIHNLMGNDIPIGVSLNAPSYNDLKKLKESGVHELRLNIETPNEDLAKKIMPNKPLESIYNSINAACNIFGKGKISSNIIIGLGETDDDIIYGIDRLASIGSIATLYPFDPINNNLINSFEFIRPSKERIYKLAIEHKRVLNKYNLKSENLKTMCCACAASHIFPGRDF